MRIRKSRSFGNTRKSLWAEQSHASKRNESFGPLAGKKIKVNLNYTVIRLVGEKFLFKKNRKNDQQQPSPEN